MLVQEQLTVSSADRSGVTVIWGNTGFSPAEVDASDRTWCLLLGEILAGPGAERGTAGQFARSMPPLGTGEPWDGLHAGVVVSDSGSITVGADLLGIFPVYHTGAREALLVASAPGLFRAHPAFTEALDPLGLTGLLLTNGLIDGHTLQRGVRRLGVGHLLRAGPNEPPAELMQYQVNASVAHHDQPLTEWAWRLHESLLGACRRHVRPEPHTLLLSGGHDSRLLAGLLARLNIPVTAITQGRTSDNDFRCARPIARSLGFHHRLVEQDGGGWNTFQSRLRWQGFTSSPGLGSDGVAPLLRGLHPRVVSGYLMDAIVGGSHIHWCYAPAEHRSGFEPWFRILNRHGIPVDTLRRLLRREVFGNAVDDMLDRVRRRFSELGQSNLERAWRFDLEHRQRFNIGNMLLRQMKGLWPVAPHIDRDVIATAGGIPLGALAGRTVEREILIRFYHHLARLPLDRGHSADTTPIDPDVRGMLRSLPGQALRRAAGALRLPTTQRSYYARTFSLDGAGWQDVRQQWEPSREAAYELFDRDTFDSLVPRAGVPWPAPASIVDNVGRRLLLASAVWATS